MNEINTIVIYPHHGGWAFDDEAVGLKAEPFVCGIPEMINILKDKFCIKTENIKLTFSALPFPGHQIKMEFIRSDCGGNWYIIPGLGEGWLCGAMFRYFKISPENIYVMMEGVE